MRALLPPAAGEIDLHDWYGDGWTDRGGVRLNFVATVDGAATALGLSRGLQTPGDNRVFAALRDLADVVVAGAGTVRAESYRPARFSAERLDRRRAHGLSEHLPIAVVSRSLTLDVDVPLFTETPPGARTIVLTAESSDPARRSELGRVADVVVAGGEAVEPAAAIAALRERGHTRILCEGGPSLFGDLGRDGVLDELCLSVTPLLAGPGAGRIVSGAPWPGGAVGLLLAGLLEEDGALFYRYRFPGAR